MFDRLEALGYAVGVKEARASIGVVFHDRERAWPGLNLYSSGHGPQAILMDMNGRVLHRWRHPIAKIWTDHPKNTGATYWRRVHLYENGDLLAIFEGIGIIKLDRSSRLLWAVPNRAHHDLQVLEDGRIWVLTREPRLIERIDPEKPILEDFLSLLDSDGKELRRVSMLSAIERSPWRDEFRLQQRAGGDVLHTNSLEVLDGRIAARNPAFAPGNLLISMPVPSTIAVVDPEAGTIVWMDRGSYRLQHDPKVLPGGELLVFDNVGPKDHSRVMELDPASGEVLWSYEGSPEHPFFTKTCGAAQRLPNGNTLISETDTGRAFETTREGKIVWDFYNPHRAGKKRRFIATLPEMIRLPGDFGADWLPAPAGTAER